MNEERIEQIKIEIAGKKKDATRRLTLLVLGAPIISTIFGIIAPPLCVCKTAYDLHKNTASNEGVTYAGLSAAFMAAAIYSTNYLSNQNEYNPVLNYLISSAVLGAIIGSTIIAANPILRRHHYDEKEKIKELEKELNELTP